jgi:hypothetical protein
MSPPPRTSESPAGAPKSPKGMSGTPKGGMGDMAGHAGMAGMGMDRRDVLIEGDSCDAEDKHVAKGGKNAHLAYNTDGYYIDKAACFVASQYKKLGGAA